MSKITLREIIVNSCDQARLVNRSQPVPGNIFVSAYTMLQRRLDGYSNTHLLSFIQKEVDISVPKEKIVLGKFKPKEEFEDRITIIAKEDDLPELPEAPNGQIYYIKESKRAVRKNDSFWAPIPESESLFDVYPDVEMDVQTVDRVFAKYGEGYIELNYIAFEDFYNLAAYNRTCYSAHTVSDEEIDLLFREPFNDLKVIYSEPFLFDADTELNIPRQYIALFTAGLTYDLAMAYPRLGDSTTSMLKQRLDELEENVRASSSIQKFIGRDPHRIYAMTRNEFQAGQWLLG